MSIGSPDFAGNPAVDRLTSIFVLTGQSIVSGGTYASSVMNVAQYQSLQVNYAESNPSYTGTTARLVRFEFYADAARAVLLDRYQLRVPANDGRIYARLPVLGPYLQVAIDSAVTTTAGSVDMYLYGSYRPAASLRSLISNAITDTLTAVNYDLTGTTLYYGTPASGASLSAWPFFWAGRARFHVRVAPIATTACEIALLDLLATTRMGGITLPVSATSQQYEFEEILTGEAFELRMINNSSAAVLTTIAINYEGMLR